MLSSPYRSNLGGGLQSLTPHRGLSVSLLDEHLDNVGSYDGVAMERFAANAPVELPTADCAPHRSDNDQPTKTNLNLSGFVGDDGGSVRSGGKVVGDSFSDDFGGNDQSFGNSQDRMSTADDRCGGSEIGSRALPIDAEIIRAQEDEAGETVVVEETKIQGVVDADDMERNRGASDFNSMRQQPSFASSSPDGSRPLSGTVPVVAKAKDVLRSITTISRFEPNIVNERPNVRPTTLLAKTSADKAVAPYRTLPSQLKTPKMNTRPRIKLSKTVSFESKNAGSRPAEAETTSISSPAEAKETSSSRLSPKVRSSEAVPSTKNDGSLSAEAKTVLNSRISSGGKHSGIASSIKKNVSESVTKKPKTVIVTDLFNDCDSLFGCNIKTPSRRKSNSDLMKKFAVGDSSTEVKKAGYKPSRAQSLGGTIKPKAKRSSGGKRGKILDVSSFRDVSTLEAEPKQTPVETVLSDNQRIASRDKHEFVDDAASCTSEDAIDTLHGIVSSKSTHSENESKKVRAQPHGFDVLYGQEDLSSSICSAIEKKGHESVPVNKYDLSSRNWHDVYFGQEQLSLIDETSIVAEVLPAHGVCFGQDDLDACSDLTLTSSLERCTVIAIDHHDICFGQEQLAVIEEEEVSVARVDIPTHDICFGQEDVDGQSVLTVTSSLEHQSQETIAFHDVLFGQEHRVAINNPTNCGPVGGSMSRSKLRFAGALLLFSVLALILQSAVSTVTPKRQGDNTPLFPVPEPKVQVAVANEAAEDKSRWTWY